MAAFGFGSSSKVSSIGIDTPQFTPFIPAKESATALFQILLRLFVNYTTNMHAHINNQPFYLLSILCVTHVINYSRTFSTFWNEATFQ